MKSEISSRPEVVKVQKEHILCFGHQEAKIKIVYGYLYNRENSSHPNIHGWAVQDSLLQPSPLAGEVGKGMEGLSCWGLEVGRV